MLSALSRLAWSSQTSGSGRPSSATAADRYHATAAAE